MAAPFLSVIAVFCITALAHAQLYTHLDLSEVANDGGSSASVCFVDIDNDGDLDLFITNDEETQGNFLYLNDGAGEFSAVDDDPILETGGHNVGATWGDYDNDGDVDCFIARWGNQANKLYTNNGDGTFVSTDLPPLTNMQSYSETASWGDYDANGRLDLFVTNSAGTGHYNFLYRAINESAFADVLMAPISTDGDDSRFAGWCDYNDDGLLDVFVANENLDNDALYHNDNGTTFSRVIGANPGTDGSSNFTASWGDIDLDGDFDLFVGTYGGTSLLYRNTGGTFERITGSPVSADNRFAVGSAFADYDNDGDLDLLVTNGFAPSNNTFRHNYLYDNDGAGNFTRAISEPIEADSGWGFGCAFGDMDDDQDLDLCIARSRNANEDNLLYRNTQTQNNGVVFKLRGTTSNRSAIGAKVRVGNMIRQVEGQNGYCGQTLDVHFGLGQGTEIDTVFVTWPTGVTEIFVDVAANNIYTITEGTGMVNVDDRTTPVATNHLVLTSYPNPFNANITLESTLPAREKTRVQVFNTLGQEVTTLHNAVAGPGVLKLNWQPTALSSGSYIVTVTQGAVADSQTIQFVK